MKKLFLMALSALIFANCTEPMPMHTHPATAERIEQEDANKGPGATQQVPPPVSPYGYGYGNYGNGSYTGSRYHRPYW